MACTPESAVHLQRSKKLPYGGSFSDSGFSDVLSCSGKTDPAKHATCRFLSSESEDYCETPKENLSVTPKKERPTETPRLLGKDLRRSQQQQSPAVVGWCETPKGSRKRDGPALRRRLLMCSKPAADGKTDLLGTLSVPSLRLETKARLSSGSSDSPDGLFGTLSSGTLRPEVGWRSPLSTRKRRLLYAQVKTSTHEYVRGEAQSNTSISSSEADLNNSSVSSVQLETPRLDKFLPTLERDACQTPVNRVSDASPCHGLFVLNTPSALTPTYVRSVSEDSGFGSVAHDKSQDSSGDHNGSFQELLPIPGSSGPRAGAEPLLHLSDGKRRSCFHRQQRLSTLREGGSQSDEDCRAAGHAGSGAKRFSQCDTPCMADEDVFPAAITTAPTTPLNSTGLLLGNRMTPLGRIAAKHDVPAPLRVAIRDTPTPVGVPVGGRSNNNATPLRTTPVGLESFSLTPALQLVQAMCLHNASLMHGQSPSFELELQTATALVETPVALRTSMPLAGLIGRKMGMGKMDVLTELKKRQLRHILAIILGHLSPEEVHRFGQVCSSWNEIIGLDRRASSKRQSHLSELEANLEGGRVHVADAETRLGLTKRVVLGTVQAQSRSLSYGTPQSAKGTVTPSQFNTSHSGGGSGSSSGGGGSSSKREKFLQVAKTLFSDECLKPCPRCQHPAKCHPVKKEGLCSRADCGYAFCTGCLCAFHGARDCLSRSAGRQGSRDVVVPGSAQSKRNLRRL